MVFQLDRFRGWVVKSPHPLLGKCRTYQQKDDGGALRTTLHTSSISSLHLQAIEHSLKRRLKGFEVTFWGDKDYIQIGSARTRAQHQPIMFRQRLSVLLDGRVAQQIDGAGIGAIGADSANLAALPQAGIRLLQILD